MYKIQMQVYSFLNFFVVKIYMHIYLFGLYDTLEVLIFSLL